MTKTKWFLLGMGGVLFLSRLSPSVNAGAWTLDPGHWYGELGSSFYWDDSEFNASGNEQPKPFQGGYDEVATKAYVEYGLIPRLNLISSVIHKRVVYTDDYSKLTNSGFQDGSLAFKWRFTENPVVFSGIVGTSFPLGYSTQQDPELGSGEWNPEARLSVGKTFVPMPEAADGVGWSRFYGNAELAKNKRSLLSSLEGGFFPASWFFAKVLLTNAWDFPSQPDGQEFSKWNFSLNVASDGSSLITRQGTKKSFNLSLGYGNIYKGRNVGSGSEWTTSVSMGF
ncbi:MAG: hypothetical protein IPN90_08900 [Elusimicrobia bacterium]|nr:hypothetical protein [Elusimicrobiota bacterium]